MALRLLVLALLLLVAGCAVEPPRRLAPTRGPVEVSSPAPRMPTVRRVQVRPHRPPPSRHAPAPPSSVESVVAVGPSDLPLRLPGPPQTGSGLPAPLVAAGERARASGMAADWRDFADAAATAGHHAEAAEAYRTEAGIRRRTGDPDGATVEEGKARLHETSVELYVHRRAGAQDAARLDTGQRLEPALGCYLGAFIDRDDAVGTLDMQGQRHGRADRFAARVGRPHASFFMYRRYGEPFPREWALYLKGQGAIPHLALEPDRLEDVRDDAWLRQFVEDARSTGWPVFIRFASEMNGAWTPYHGDPAAYRRAFRTVYAAFRRAPLAALIWCPNTMPEKDIEAYYPGDDATDWVGVNFYSVLYQDNDRTRPGDRIHPADMLDYVYRRWSGRKPIAIGEWAATHRSALEGRDRPEFARTKIAQLYESLPTRYPRVKLVDWYDCDNLEKARGERRLNDYLLTDLPSVTAAYRAATASPWFLGASRDPRSAIAPVAAVALEAGAAASRADVIEARVRTFTDQPEVYFRVDGKVVAARRGPGGHRLAMRDLPSGAREVEVLVYAGGRFVSRASRKVRVD